MTHITYSGTYMNTYATDGKCHNANRGTYGHECGKPAVWIGIKASGFTSGFCDGCKRHGDEAVGMVQWHLRPHCTAAFLPSDRLEG